MSPHEVLPRALEGGAQHIIDPGTSGVIRPSNRLLTVVRFAAAATGNRDVASPSSIGQMLLVNCAGAPTTSVVLRFGSVPGSNAGVYNTSGTYLTGAKAAVASVTLDAVGEFAQFVSVEDGSGTFKWALVAGVGLAVA